MKFQVSVLTEKKKSVVLVVVADRFEETFGTYSAKVRFYRTVGNGWWQNRTSELIASAVLHGNYVVEEASDETYS